MTRDDLYGHYRRFYVPNNATLVIVGDVETDAAMRDVATVTSRRFSPAKCRATLRTQRARAAR